MAMKLHELHPMMVHTPLVLLPAAAAVDLVASQSGCPSTERLGAKLWWWGTGAGLLAGLAGMAASQEVKGGDQEVDDAMYLHGIGNLAGAVVGGVLLGLIEAIGSGYLGLLSGGVLGSHYSDIVAFIVLIVGLRLRPSGLLGERVADRA
jgi:branched-subunit amino acid ABC-type transport system permease component